MNKHRDLGELLLRSLEAGYELEREDIGADALLSKKGMRFETESYAVRGLGHLCILRMRAFLGLMRMETAVLAVTGKDSPLLNLDWVLAAGRETQMAELYDVQLRPCPEEDLRLFQALKDRDGDLPDRKTEGHWYDSILYPCSYDKTGKGLSERFNRAAEGYVQTYLKLLEKAPVCDPAEKAAKVRSFAETLVEKGGPAVDTVTKLFGAETAKRLILRHMYGAAE